MGDANNSVATAAENKTPLHPVYTISNIQNKIQTLDGVKTTYSSWVKLFKLHAKGYDVLNHIDGTEAPAKFSPTYESWVKIDAIVLQWIYGTLSHDLMRRVLDCHSTTYQAWTNIESIFLDNKKARAVALETQFTNLTLTACSSLDDYCQQLRDLAEQLKDADQPMDESRLII
ncbi:uncharacterized protein LOC143557292 [Bidens hawaiensis]|uniref:uncharacterized protein LOC143557292 n=1 Tax=Bidens hawaiensis TaxID=980011 RepID=UPI00404B2004